MRLTITFASPSRTPLLFYFFHSDLTPRREMACPTPLKYLQSILSSGDGCLVDAEHKSDPIGLLLMPIYFPLPGMEALIQPTEPMEKLRMLHRAWKQPHPS
jgi:hypothetical protein